MSNLNSWWDFGRKKTLNRGAPTFFWVGKWNSLFATWHSQINKKRWWFSWLVQLFIWEKEWTRKTNYVEFESIWKLMKPWVLHENFPCFPLCQIKNSYWINNDVSKGDEQMETREKLSNGKCWIWEKKICSKKFKFMRRILQTT